MPILGQAKLTLAPRAKWCCVHSLGTLFETIHVFAPRHLAPSGAILKHERSSKLWVCKAVGYLGPKAWFPYDRYDCSDR